MNDAAQICRCNSAPCANPVLPQTPNLKISNRESLRLEINVTQTKQTTQPRSNRELEALFLNRVRADDSARRYIARAVNRLRDCRAIDSARQKIHPPAKTNPPEPGSPNTRRSSITQFNKQFRKRSIKAPSKNVSVRKKSAERFQSLTQILIDTMFRLEILARRTRGERIETGGIPQTA
jgi:hypothetical protein